MKRNWTRLFIFLALVACLGFGATAQAADTLKFGALATLEGPFTVMGEDSLRGVKLALKQFNNTVAGKKNRINYHVLGCIPGQRDPSGQETGGTGQSGPAHRAPFRF